MNPFSSGITINGKHSLRNFDVYIAERDIGMPEKKSVLKTVPFFNGFYDFSSLNGYPSWGSRLIKYVFDVVSNTIAETERLKSSLLTWLCNVENEPIYDDDIPNYHFKGSFTSASVDEDESGLKMTVTVTYTCYPFLIANEETEIELGAGDNTVTVSGQPISPGVVTTSTATITVGNRSVSLPASAEINLGMMLNHDVNVVNTTAPVTLKWREERI